MVNSYSWTRLGLTQTPLGLCILAFLAPMSHISVRIANHHHHLFHRKEWSPPPPTLPLAWLPWLDLSALCSSRQLSNGQEFEGVQNHSSTHSSLWEETRSLQAFTEKSSLCQFSWNKDCLSHHRGLFSGQSSQRMFVPLRNACNSVSFLSLL